MEVLKSLPAESVDLVYLDPPFFSNRNYEVIWGDDGEVRSFKDRWAGGMDHYIGWLKDRVQEMYRVLKPTGSIYLHCDWHADAYIRVEILDKIFGAGNFISTIVWKRQTAKKGSQYKKKSYGQSTDTIFFYSKTNKYFFEIPVIQLSQAELEKKFDKIDESGKRFRLDNILRNKSLGARPNLVYEYKGYTPEYFGWMVSKEKLENMDVENRIFWSNSGRPYRKYFMEEYVGQEVSNIWTDIFIASGEEAIGYPTQKPEKLLERIIQASSNEGDMVLDPFLGGGTTAAVARKLHRSFIGIDASPIAVAVSEGRLEKQTNLYTKPFTVITQKYDYNKMRYADAFEFEKFIVEKSGGVPNTKQRGDMGLDGVIGKMPVQVKRSDNIGRNIIDNFSSACQRFDRNLYNKNIEEKKPIGRIIAFSFGKGAIEEVARLKNTDNIIIELVKVEDIIPLSTNPKVEIKITRQIQTEKGWELSFEAASNQTILQYQWDMDYKDDTFKPEHIYSGENSSKISCTLRKGTYIVACRVTNEDGIHGFETIKIKVNGKVENL